MNTGLTLSEPGGSWRSDCSPSVGCSPFALPNARSSSLSSRRGEISNCWSSDAPEMLLAATAESPRAWSVVPQWAPGCGPRRRNSRRSVPLRSFLRCRGARRSWFCRRRLRVVGIDVRVRVPHLKNFRVKSFCWVRALCIGAVAKLMIDRWMMVPDPSTMRRKRRLYGRDSAHGSGSLRRSPPRA